MSDGLVTVTYFLFFVIIRISIRLGNSNIILASTRIFKSNNNRLAISNINRRMWDFEIFGQKNINVNKHNKPCVRSLVLKNTKTPTGHL